jgi:hypothetical protein
MTTRCGDLRACIEQRGQLVNILTVNLLFSTFVFWVAARIYLLPKLPELRPQAVILPILLLHSFRHLGLMFLAPGATYVGIPPQFAYPAAFETCLPLFLLWRRFRLYTETYALLGCSYGFSTWKERWI